MSLEFSMDTPSGPRVTIAGRERDYFSGTGYLGLHNHPAVRQAALEAIQQYGMATGTSRGGYGEHILYDELEAEARAFFDCEAVLYFPSGYMSALLLAQGQSERYERIFIDEWSHFSLWDGARAAGKSLTAFAHLDAQALADALKRELRPGERPLLFSDGVFPISGEVAPVPAYLDVLAHYADSRIALDDAHGAGAIGPNGRGTLDFHGVYRADCLAGATLSKALGGYGGIIPAGRGQIEEITRCARVYVGASPPPLPNAAASRAALCLARTQPDLRWRLLANVRRVRDGLRAQGWEVEDSPVPIVCLRARPGVDLARIKEELFARDLCIAHVKNYSSTPPGGALRIAVFATHAPDQIERLLAAFQRLT
jgi:glycine C-acetyltransferase/8-amino-7-oxononanoate synthase